MNSIVKRLLLIGIVAVIGTGAATAAYFTYQVSANGNSIVTGNLKFSINGKIGNTSPGAALVATNMYPGAFDESAVFITNDGSINLNPGISLANAVDTNGLGSKLWLQIWTNGKLWYNDWITNAPGYTSGKVVLDSIAPGASEYVAIRLILDESATVSGPYSVNVNIIGYQWNDPAGAVTSSVSDSSYTASTWSYNVCGVRPSSPWYTPNENGWSTHLLGDGSRGTNTDGSCTVL